MHRDFIKVNVKIKHIFLLTSLCVSSFVHAVSYDHTYYRSFWHPTFEGLRLAWCIDGGKECGTTTADRYCKIMGFDRSVERLKAYDIGLSRYLGTQNVCEKWNCDGFTKIKCIREINEVKADYHYRKRIFYYPRFQDYRVDWCYKTRNRGCGARVAKSFCRRLGYMRSINYKKETQVGETRQLGSNKLCYGKQCDGFQYIVCYR
jgi:hypothetical protein